MDAVAAGDGLGRVQRVADVDVGEEPVEPVALVLGRVELEGDGLAVERLLGEGGRLGAEARRGPVRVDDLGRVDADDPDRLDAARQLDVDRVAVDDLDDGPGEGRGVGAAWATGPRWVIGVGAIVGVGETRAADSRVSGRCGFGGRGRDRGSAAARGSTTTMTAPAASRPIFLRDIRR